MKSITVEKNTEIKATLRFMDEKMIMFAKISLASFIYDIINIFSLPFQSMALAIFTQKTKL